MPGRGGGGCFIQVGNLIDGNITTNISYKASSPCVLEELGNFQDSLSRKLNSS